MSPGAHEWQAVVVSNKTPKSCLMQTNQEIKINDNGITSFQHAEFEWERQIQSTLLASFFYGYIITQIPGGWLADRYGGRRVFGVAMAIACACTLLTPVCARTSVILVYCIRGILGLVTVSICSPLSVYHKV